MEKYDLIIIGTGFASSFFLKQYLAKTKNTNVLVLERGNKKNDLAWQIENRKFSPIEYENTYINLTPKKKWFGSIGFGGASSNWAGNTPRMMPNDFKLKSKYGVGNDWPISYDDLEPYYCQVEKVMQISGPKRTPYPMSKQYPLPPHLFNSIDKLMFKKYPYHFFSFPTARPSIATQNRPQCCASTVCEICPIDSKATVLNTLSHLYNNSRVTLQVDSRVTRFDLNEDHVSKVYYYQDGKEKSISGEVVALGAHAIHNPHILLNSGDTHPWLGKGLGEQVSIHARVLLNNLSNSLSGSTRITGIDYLNYDGEHRKSRAGYLIEYGNFPKIRFEKDKWTNFVDLRIVIEDLPSQKNYVKLSDDPFLPEVYHGSYSDYTQRSLDYIKKNLIKQFSHLPVEKIEFAKEVSATEGHTQGTVRMSLDPKEGIVDKNLVHHKYRNLIVLGSSAFPTFSPANPTLTLSALSLYSADNLF